MWRTDYYRGCCTFEAFTSGFVAAALRHKVPLILIDRLRARRDWRAGMTGAEALLTQRGDLLREGEYVWLQAT